MENRPAEEDQSGLICLYCERAAAARCLIYGCHALVCGEHMLTHFEEKHGGTIFEDPTP